MPNPKDEHPMMPPVTPTSDSLAASLLTLVDLWQIKSVLTLGVSTICAWIGADAYLVTVLAIAMTIDFVLGIYSAFRRGHFRCRAMQYGILKYLWYSAYIAVVGLVNISVARSFHINLPLLNLFISYLTLTESVSIVGHLQAIGVPVPELLSSIVNRSKRRVESKINGLTTPEKPRPGEDPDFRERRGMEE